MLALTKTIKEPDELKAVSLFRHKQARQLIAPRGNYNYYALLCLNNYYDESTLVSVPLLAVVPEQLRLAWLS